MRQNNSNTCTTSHRGKHRLSHTVRHPDTFNKHLPGPDGQSYLAEQISIVVDAHHAGTHYQNLALAHMPAHQWVAEMKQAKQAMAKGFITLGLKARQRSNLLGNVDVLLRLVVALEYRRAAYGS
mgnify:FL=1